jgi:hypothetical protein
MKGCCFCENSNELFISLSLSLPLFSLILSSLFCLFQHSAQHEQLLLTFIRMPNGKRMVSLWLEEMEKAMELINSTALTGCMLMMIKLSMSLIGRIIVLCNGNRVRRVAKWLPVEMEKEVGLISCLTHMM